MSGVNGELPRKGYGKMDAWYREPTVGNYQDDLLYWKNHSQESRILDVIRLVNTFADCNSILDVGCRSVGLLSQVGAQYVYRVQTDIYPPEYLGGADGIHFEQGDFLEIPFLPVDVVLCLETMEHIEPSRRVEFAKKLLRLAGKHLIVSIPYMWDARMSAGCLIPHEGYNETHIRDWFGDRACTMQHAGAHLIVHYEMGAK
jgi:2-polyprenyl-3-methyl-5-hydroxy-6-metoxy-1,4-benzoquinol methylase